MAATSFRLSDAQVLQFREEGFVVLRGFVEPATVAGWRDQFWARHHAAGARADDPSTWQHISTAEDDLFMPRQPLFGELPQTRSVLRQLGGSGFHDGTRGGEPTDMLIPTLPESLASVVEQTSDKGRPSPAQRATPHLVRRPLLPPSTCRCTGMVSS
jgi:hypothetical protein